MTTRRRGPSHPTPGDHAPTSRELILGIDPGGHWSGFVLRDRDDIARAVLVTNPFPLLHGDYLAEVLDTAAELAAEAQTVAVEGLTHPNPHLGLANVAGLLDTAQVIGALRCRFATLGIDPVFVDPAGHGSGPLRSYPPVLVGDRERKGTGKYRHLRSAFDVAGAAFLHVTSQVG
jgi:hypothetical protein